LAFLNKGVTLTIEDHREALSIDDSLLEEQDEEVHDTGSFRTDTFYSENGLLDFVKYLDKTRVALTDTPIYLETQRTNIPIEIAMPIQYGVLREHSLVRQQHQHHRRRYTPDRVRRGLTTTLKNYAEKSGDVEQTEI